MDDASDTTLARRFGCWAAALTRDDIPDLVALAARRSILDTLGVMTAGAAHPATQRAIAAFGGEPGSCRTIDGARVSAASAALINGTAAHAWDFDDTSYTGIMHGSAVILPALLAAADEMDADDAAVLAAFIAGSEIAYALGDVLTHSHYFRGWWSTVTLGTIGATAAAGKIYGLDAHALASAIGLAAANAGGGKAVFGTDGKPFLVGLAARTALDIARAARAGLDGPAQAFEDQRGFIALLNDGKAMPAEAATLGIRWRLVDPGLLIKRYPVCSAAHALIEQTAALCHMVDADRIAAIDCHVSSLVDISLVYDEPVNAQQAQFSLPYAAACAALRGGLALDDLGSAAIADPKVRALMRKVSRFVDPDLSSDAARARAPESARVVVRLTDGSRREGLCPVAYGMPTRPLTDDDLAAKFSACVSFAGRSAETASDRLKSLGKTGAREFSASLAAIWSSERKDDPIPVLNRLARALPEEGRRSGVRVE
ncbi:MAG: MmgE/PrpD family protein [Pseudolabrys sp.]